MNAQELFSRAPIGSVVTCSNGTARPPDRFKRKLSAWEGKNFTGRLVGIDPGDPSKTYGRATFTLRTLDSDVLICNLIYTLDSTLSFEFTPPPVGTILAFSRHGGLQEASHVWQTFDGAKQWAARNRYDLLNCGLCLYRVNHGGTLDAYTPDPA